jgi:hypothetical protein
MHLVGFTIEIYYDARPYERQIYRFKVDVIIQQHGIPCYCMITSTLYAQSSLGIYFPCYCNNKIRYSLLVQFNTTLSFTSYFIRLFDVCPP